MIEISIEADRAVFEVEGWDQLWSLRSRLEIPVAHINGARVDTLPAWGWFQGLKLSGTDLPNLFRAGTYYQDGGSCFGTFVIRKRRSSSICATRLIGNWLSKWKIQRQLWR